MKTSIVLFSMLVCFNLLFAQKEILQSDTAKNGNITYQRYDISVNPENLSQAQSHLRKVLQMRDADSFCRCWSSSPTFF